MKRKYLDTIYYFLKAYRLLCTVTLIVSLLVVLLEFFSLAALLPVFNSMLGVSADTGGGISFSVIEQLLKMLPFKDRFVAAFTLLIILILLRSLVGISAEFLNAFTSGKIMYETKNKMLEKYSNAPYQFFLETKQGELLYNIINAPTRLAYVLYRIPRFVLELLKIIAIILLLLYINVYVTLVLIVLSFSFSVLITFLSNRFSYVLGKKRMNLSTQQTTLVNEIFNGIKQLIVYGVRDKWRSKFDLANKRYIGIYIKDISWVAVPKYLIDIFGYLAMFGVIIFIKKYYPERFIVNLPIIGIFAMAVIRILPSLGNIGRLRMEITGALPDGEVIYKTLNTKFEDIKFGNKIFEDFNHAIVFEGVHFAHKGHQDLLKGINITFRKNEVTAIVGTTGSGKTTIINLLLGLFQPTAGKIRVDGVDLKEFRIEEWLKKIGLVSQDTFTFHSTIADNISLGVNKYSKQDIAEAARISGADKFIKNLPSGYDMIVGEKGMKLSGGQQQCLAIARAMIRKPQILILDEATSALDGMSEKIVQEAINNISKQLTVIIIAHRLSSVQNADNIIVIKDGITVEEGKHADLLNKRNYYWHLYNTQ